METATVYISAMQESLQKKQGIMEKLLVLTQEQSELLAQPQMDMERFEEILESKDALIAQIESLDNGFDRVFQKLSSLLKTDKETYRSDIEKMQKFIREITDCGVRIEGLERKNRDAFQKYLLNERQEIKNSRASNRTAVSYYQNMPNQHHEWQTYFMDQKK
ncbi:MAG: flagellar export chaperone FlgN [Lachnospiraceae bacterium]|nr:flagellar export chaperone FlgN [Lachnospiraceae bacterium]